VYYVALLMAVAFWLWRVQTDPANYADMTWWKTFLYLQFTEGYYTHDPQFYLKYAHWFRHSWSLAAEEQFYVLWPLAMLLLRGRRELMLAFCLALLATSIAMRAAGFEVILLLTRADGFALGGALAILQEMTSERGGIFESRLNFVYWGFMLAGISVLVPYMWGGYTGGQINQYHDIATYGNWTILVTAFSGFFFGLIGLMRNGHLLPVKRFLSWRPFTQLGEWSYAIYMFQGIIALTIGLAAHKSGLFPRFVPEVVVDLVSVLSCIAIGPISRYLIEGRFEHLKARFPVVRQDRLSAVPDPDAGSLRVAPSSSPEVFPAPAPAPHRN
jgi:peptidoglycan/LPS O-acetylase OafA/YrhL